MERNLEDDIKALTATARADRGFAVELYAALCNAEWRHDDGTEWRGTWRHAADVVAHLRDLDENYLDFFCSGGEGEISERVEEAMAALRWHGVGHGYGVGHGSQLRISDFQTGETCVLNEDGEWEPQGPSDTS